MFGIAVSGIKGSQKHIDVTSNNIANSNTYGFKKSRAEFADIYANSVYINNRTASGMGVQNTVVSQQFAQGNLSGDTGNSLDMAIQGNGFFVLGGSPATGATEHTFTRNGAFQVDKNGYIVTATGQFLQGWDVNADGSSTSLDLNSTHGIKVPEDAGAPQMSTQVGIGVNFPADKDPAPIPSKVTDFDGKNEITDYKYGVHRGPNGEKLDAPAEGGFTQYYTKFDPKKPDTYTASTSQTIHDSLGRAHTLTYYMFKVGPQSEGSTDTVWNVIPFVDGKPVDVAAQGNENPIMVSVQDSTSSVNGAHFFGFQVVCDANGEQKSTVPASVQLVNPKAGAGGDGGEGGPEGPDGPATPEYTLDSLREILFGKPGEPEASGTLDKAFGKGGQLYDPTFEDVIKAGEPSTIDKPALFKDQNGSLFKVMGVGINPNQIVNIDFNATQYGSSNFTVTQAPTNDGYSTGILLGVTVNKEGVIQCEFSNGQIKNIAKVAMADFVNVQGLTKIGDTQWRQSHLSGEAIAKEAGQGSAGNIIGSNLEMSNVDLTSELVELIVAQRNYQANSQSLQTQNTVMDSILNIR